MNLYEIDNAINDLIDDDTGEIVDLLAFNELNIERDKKIENIALYIKNLTSEINALKEEESNIKERISKKKNKVENLNKYLSGYIQAVGLNKFETSKVVIGFRKSSKVEIDNEEEFVNKYKQFANEKVTYSIDKKSLKEYLKDNELLGARIIENKNINIK